MKRFVFLVFLTCSSPLLAGECRDEVQPYVRNTQPSLALDEVRSLCETEYLAGDPDAIYQLALLDLGVNGAWHPDEAIRKIREAAQRGVPEAQYWLAWQYEEGPLLTHETATARDWYLRAADKDHRLALARLVRAYESGELGLPRDARKAAEFKARQARCN